MEVGSINASMRNGRLSHGGGAITRWFRARWNLTPQERHNLRMSCTPVAVVTASLGGHTAACRRQ
ncbi:MAG TPA: hypothetical protein DIW80_17450 [Gordonia polyisoprenivorans]|nr:hypothetical protein [Gordonia polyisoprenivorans]